MYDEPEIPRIASLLADPARAKMLWTLIDGTARPAGELAYAANISAQSASGHLAKLVKGGLLIAEPQGRHRYFRISNAVIAGVIEGMASLSVATSTPAPRSQLPSLSAPEFLYARTCYGHLAGEIAVKILEAMLRARWLIADGRDFAVTQLGETKLTALDVDLALLRRSRGVVARACLDLTQRRPHLAGSLGDTLLECYVARGWIRRHRRSRVVGITPKGYENFRRLFGI